MWVFYYQNPDISSCGMRNIKSGTKGAVEKSKNGKTKITEDREGERVLLNLSIENTRMICISITWWGWFCLRLFCYYPNDLCGCRSVMDFEKGWRRVQQGIAGYSRVWMDQNRAGSLTSISGYLSHFLPPLLSEKHLISVSYILLDLLALSSCYFTFHHFLSSPLATSFQRFITRWWRWFPTCSTVCSQWNACW